MKFLNEVVPFLREVLHVLVAMSGIVFVLSLLTGGLTPDLLVERWCLGTDGTMLIAMGAFEPPSFSVGPMVRFSLVPFAVMVGLMILGGLPRPSAQI